MARDPTVVEIDGEPFTLVKPPFGIRLGFAPKEPGSPGQLSTVVIPSFHLGGGEFMAQTPGRFFKSTYVEPAVPAQLTRVGVRDAAGVTVGLFPTAAADAQFYAGALLLLKGETDGATSAGVKKDRTVVVTPKEVRVVDTGAHGTNVLTQAAPLNMLYTGSVAKHKGIVYLPLEGDSAHATPRQATGMSRYEIVTNTFLTNVTDAAMFASRVLSSRGLFWWVQNKGLGGTPVIRAHTSPADPAPANVAGPFDLAPGNYCTGLFRFGYWIRAAMADGNLHGVDEEGIIAPFLPETLAVPSSQTGAQTVAFLDKIAIAAPSRIFALDLASLQVSDITPPVLQSVQDWDSIGTPAMFSDGVELWAAVTDQEVAIHDSTNGLNDAVALWRLLQHPDGNFAWHKIAYVQRGTTPATGEDLAAAGLLLRETTTQRFADILTHKTSGTPLGTASLFTVEVPKPGTTAIVSSPETARAFLETSRYRSGEFVTAKFLQLRGFQRVAPTPAQTWAFEVDGSGTFTTLGTVGAAGPFSLAFPATAVALGRLCALKNSGDPGRLAMPLYIDYLEIPSATDDLTVDVLASDRAITQAGSILRGKGRLGIVEFLRSKRGQIVTLGFLDAVDTLGKPTTWTILVIDVEVLPLKEGALTPHDSRVSLLVRRL